MKSKQPVVSLLSLFFLLSLFLFSPSDSQAKVHTGIIGAVKHKVKELREKKDEAFLTWTGEINYGADGLNFECGNTSTTFIYRISYKNSLGKPPRAGYPRLHVKKNGSEVAGSPFLMSFQSGNFRTGAIYSHSLQLSSGDDYSYYFEAEYSKDDASVTRLTTNEITSPFVTDGSGTNGCWQIQEVDRGAVSYTSLAFDGSGKPSIIYTKQEAYSVYLSSCYYTYYEYKCDYYREIRYRDNLNLAVSPSSGSWSISRVDASTEITHPSHTVDGAGDMRVLYIADGNLKYAKRTEGVWAMGTIDTGNYSYSALAVDGTGAPHAAYYNITGQKLKYARWTEGVWAMGTPDPAGNVGKGTAISVDASNNPHISYWDSSNNLLKHAVWNGSVWTVQIVDAAGLTLYPATSLDLDALGYPHISYYNSALKYAGWTGAGWNIQTIDAGVDVGSHNSIKVDSSGNPRISYYDATVDALKFAAWDGGAWVKKTVDTGTGRFNSLKLLGGNIPGISYSDGAALKYAEWVP